MQAYVTVQPPAGPLAAGKAVRLNAGRNEGRTAVVLTWGEPDEGPLDCTGPVVEFDDDHEVRWYPGHARYLLSSATEEK